MGVGEAIILGIVQGITEFLPVSSSGHLIAIPAMFGWDLQPYDFDVIIHLATLAAILFVFRSDVHEMMSAFFKHHASVEKQLARKLIAASIPVFVLGFFLSDATDSIRTIQVVAVMLIVWGILLMAADRALRARRFVVKQAKHVSWVQAIIIGLIQSIALIPGTSRSGATITAGLFLGLSRDAAARFSFLLAIPAIAGAGTYVLIETLSTGFQTSGSALIAGFFAAMLSGIVAIQFLLAFVKRASFHLFGVYRIILGILLLIFFV
ncbi:MAG: undecaprenyl-diphosphatase UppP [bacterium]|nr:undecaprenyl-diphosphatase UppP [bacterium]